MMTKGACVRHLALSLQRRAMAVVLAIPSPAPSKLPLSEMSDVKAYLSCSGWEMDAGLCYPDCPANYQGVGPVCWANCPAGNYTCGAICLDDSSECSSKIDAVAIALLTLIGEIAECTGVISCDPSKLIAQMIELIQELGLSMCPVP